MLETSCLFKTSIVLSSHFFFKKSSFFAVNLWQLSNHYFYLSNHSNFCQLQMCDLRKCLPDIVVFASPPQTHLLITHSTLGSVIFCGFLILKAINTLYPIQSDLTGLPLSTPRYPHIYEEGLFFYPHKYPPHSTFKEISLN